MKIYNVYRSILSSDPDGHKTLQKIARIVAEDYHVAYTRAKFIKGFHSWDDQVGTVVDDTKPQPQHETASFVPTHQASHYCNESLQRQKQLIDQEIEQHSRKLSILQETFESMLATM